MNRNIFIVLGVVVVVLIAFFALRGGEDRPDTADQGTGNTQVVSEEETKYTDPGGRFTFVHPKSLQVSTLGNALTKSWRANAATSGYLLASVIVPKTYLPQTNFSDAKFTVGQSTDKSELSSTGCPANAHPVPGSAAAVTINGQTFTKMTTADAGAGNFYQTTGYYTIRDGDCYAIEYTIHSTNIANYPASAGIKEFDKDKIYGLLEDMVKSFVFTINSD